MPVSDRVAYISGPLHASNRPAHSRRFYEYVADICQRHGVMAIIPHLMNDALSSPDLDPTDVYENDTSMLLGSDVLVAHVGAPSSGVGAEVAIAIQAGIPIIALWRPDEKVSWYLLGLLRAAGAHELVSEDDALEGPLREALDEVSGPRSVRAHYLPTPKRPASWS